MPKLLKLTTRVSVDAIPPVDTGTLTRDGLQRIVGVVANYQSVKVTYTIPWLGSNIEVAGIATRTIEDLQ